MNHFQDPVRRNNATPMARSKSKKSNASNLGWTPPRTFNGGVDPTMKAERMESNRWGLVWCSSAPYAPNRSTDPWFYPCADNGDLWNIRRLLASSLSSRNWPIPPGLRRMIGTSSILHNPTNRWWWCWSSRPKTDPLPGTTAILTCGWGPYRSFAYMIRSDDNVFLALMCRPSWALFQTVRCTVPKIIS